MKFLHLFPITATQPIFIMVSNILGISCMLTPRDCSHVKLLQSHHSAVQDQPRLRRDGLLVRKSRNEKCSRSNSVAIGFLIGTVEV